MVRYLSRYITVICILSLIAGCSAGLTPDLRTGLELSTDGRSLIEKNETFKIKVGIYDQYLNIGTNDVFVSFLVTVKNLTSSPQQISQSSFFLLDQNSRQYQPYSSKQLMELVKSRYSYMLPYPFVGYYYSNDEAFPTVLGSSISDAEPYRLLKSFAQFDSVILPGANIEGVLYFPVDTSQLQAVQLQIFSSIESSSSVPDFTFPFSVEK